MRLFKRRTKNGKTIFYVILLIQLYNLALIIIQGGLKSEKKRIEKQTAC